MDCVIAFCGRTKPGRFRDRRYRGLTVGAKPPPHGARRGYSGAFPSAPVAPFLRLMSPWRSLVICRDRPRRRAAAGLREPGTHAFGLRGLQTGEQAQCLF